MGNILGSKRFTEEEIKNFRESIGKSNDDTEAAEIIRMAEDLGLFKGGMFTGGNNIFSTTPTFSNKIEKYSKLSSKIDDYIKNANEMSTSNPLKIRNAIILAAIGQSIQVNIDQKQQKDLDNLIKQYLDKSNSIMKSVKNIKSPPNPNNNLEEKIKTIKDLNKDLEDIQKQLKENKKPTPDIAKSLKNHIPPPRVTPPSTLPDIPNPKITTTETKGGGDMIDMMLRRYQISKKSLI